MAGGAVAWLVAGRVGGGGSDGTLRADIDAAVARVASLEARLAAVESERKSAAGQAVGAGAEDLRALAQDLHALREWIEAELKAANEQFADLRRRIDDANSPPVASSDTPPTTEEEDRWTTLARDADSGVRFSALQRLGRVRTDRSVHVSIECLADESPVVLWQALRNLGRFRETAAAVEVAALLTHAEPAVGMAAYTALVEMGAPKDTGFDDLSAKPEKRKAAAAVLRAWAESR